MFNNPFLKKDSLLEAVKEAQAEGELRRMAEAHVNEQFGVYSRKAVVREDLAAYDAAIEEAVKCMKEGKPVDQDKDGDNDFADVMIARMKKGGKSHPEAIAATKNKSYNMKEGNVSLKDVRDADAAQNPSGYAAMRNKSEDQALERAGKGLARDIKEKKMWEGQEDSSSGLPPSAAATQAAKQTPTPASTPKKTGTSDLSSTFSSARGATGMQEAQLDELKAPTGKTARQVVDRAERRDDEEGNWTRSNRLYKNMKRRYPGKSARVQKDTGKADLPDVGNIEFHKAGYSGHVTKAGKLTKAASRDTKDGIKSRLGKHTAPNLPEETIEEATRKHFRQHAADISKISDQEERNKAASAAASTYARLNPRFDHAKFHKAAGSTAHQPEKVNEEKWIQAALSKKTKGALHKDLNVSQKKKISLSKLKAASDDPGKTGKRARLAMTLRKLRERLESDSFKAAQGTGKSVNEVAMGMPPAITPPAIAGQRMPGIMKRSGTASGKFINQTTVKANQPPKTGTSLVPSGNRLPAATSNKLPVPAGSNSVTAASTPKAGGGSGFTYSRGPSTPGVNPPHPSEKIGGFGNFKPASSGGGMSGLAKGIGSAVAKVARIATNPIVGGVAAAMDPTPANQGENEFARQAKYAAKSKPAEAPKQAAPAAAKPAAPVKQSFSQAYRAARDAASAAKQDPNKAQFKWTNEKGKEGTYQAAATKKDYVPASKQFKTSAGSTAAPSTQASTDTTTASAPTPPSRPKDLTPTSQRAMLGSGNTNMLNNKISSGEKTNDFAKGVNTDKAVKDNTTPEKMQSPTDSSGRPAFVPPFSGFSDREFRSKKTIPGSTAAVEKVQENDEKSDEKTKAPKPMMTTFSPSAPMGNIPKMSDHPPSSLKEEVTVGNNKYRIV